MKFFIVFLALASMASADLKEFVKDFKAVVKEVANTCAKEVGATNDDIDSLLVKKEIPDKQEARCLILCMHKNWGIQNSEGKLDLDAATKTLAPIKDLDADVYEKAKSVMTTCFEKVGDDADPCVTAANVAKCGKEESAKLGLDESYEI